MSRADDARWMQRALALARRGEGLTRPNPPVGAVVVRGGRVVAEDFHRKAGTLHAEALALKTAGSAARNATLYVTLEPCCTHGRTPPCTDLILALRPSRVVVGARDPNPLHAGKGLGILRRHGIEVTEGVCRAEAEALIEPFRKWILTGLPFVTLKLGMTLDGRIADAAGRSRWITGLAARALTQAWRRRCDAILVGSETARRDDPSLLPRPPRGRKPLRVVVSSDANLPDGLQMFRDAADRTLVMVSSQAPAARCERLRATGAEVVGVRARQGRPSLRAVLRKLGARGTLHVLCEGGGQVAEALLRERLVDQVLLMIAPKILGGAARCAVAGRGWPLDQAPKLMVCSIDACGEDLVLLCRPSAISARK